MSQKSITKRFEGDDAIVLGELGHRLATERLRRNWTQAELAEEAGVSRSTVRRLEAGESTQMTNLIRILRALRLLPNLEALVPTAVTGPIERLEKNDRPRRRASSKRRRPPPTTPPADEPESPWRWGDES